MKLLCTADLHYRLPQLDWLVEQAGDVDVVVIPGDHLQVVGAAPLEVQIVVVSKYLQRLSEQALVLASSGNHDLDGPGPTGEQATEMAAGAGIGPTRRRRSVDRRRRSALHRVSVVGRDPDPTTGRRSAGSGRRRPSGSVDLGVSLATGRLTPVPGGLEGVSRPRPRGVDRPLASRSGDLWPHPPGALGRRWRMGRPAGLDVARQRRSSAGADAGSHRDRPRRIHR